MFRFASLVLSLAVLATAICADNALAKGHKGHKGQKSTEIPFGYATVESVDIDAKTFKLANDPKTYKYTDATTNKDQLIVGSVIKVTLKEGSDNEVTLIDLAPAKAKGGKGQKGGGTPAGYFRVESVDTDAKTFKLANDPKTYKYTDATINKSQIVVGSAIKPALKEGSADEVSAVDTAPAKIKKGKGKGKKKS